MKAAGGKSAFMLISSSVLNPPFVMIPYSSIRFDRIAERQFTPTFCHNINSNDNNIDVLKLHDDHDNNSFS